MSSDSSARAVTATEQAQMKRSDDIQSVVHGLTALAVKGLPSMFYPDRQLFCHRLKREGSRIVQEGISPRYTAMTLMGLHRLEQSGGKSPVDIRRVLDGLLTNTAWIDNIGDLGILLWTCAQIAPERLDELDHRLDIKSALERFRDAKQRSTMGLAWYLTGLSYEALARPEKLGETRELAMEAYRRILRNQGKEGIFGHVGSNEGLTGILRSGVGSFADQVYPIYAMAKFSQAYGEENALKRALDCALTICEAQGSLGQWWWHYDSSNGRVAESFPVFSVHQHAMGPLALLALGQAVQSDFSPWIYKGLQWIDDNELGFDMKDNAANVVWRCIERTRPNRVWNAAVNLVAHREDRETRASLRTLFECRPYELGWLLYAFANWNRA
jgi:hypothetical protein